MITSELKDQSLDEWLTYIEGLHSKVIDLGLERMQLMLKRFNLQFDCPILLVGGTNGKGSTCTFLESICLNAGLDVALHTSPHIVRFNERARMNGKEVRDEELVRYLKKVEMVRGDVSLSYFEYTLLAILLWFRDQKPDVVILEVGLGGRLDATNALDPTASIVTTVDLDHTQFLGDTRDAIGWEKAHIYRKGRPAVCADPSPPQMLIDYAEEIGADLILANKDYSIQISEAGAQWRFECRNCIFENLPRPSLAGAHQIRNAAGALALLCSTPQLFDKISREAVVEGLISVRLRGRFECISSHPQIICDVGHNPHAAVALKDALEDEKCRRAGRTLAVFGMLKDKDRNRVCKILANSFDIWYVSSLGGDRGGRAEELGRMLSQNGVDSHRIFLFEDVKKALEASLSQACAEDRIIIFGSFLTVNDAVKYLHKHPLLLIS